VRCYTAGKDLLDWLNQPRYAPNRAYALELARALMHCQLIKDINGGTSFRSESTYRLTVCTVVHDCNQSDRQPQRVCNHSINQPIHPSIHPCIHPSTDPTLVSYCQRRVITRKSLHRHQQDHYLGKYRLTYQTPNSKPTLSYNILTLMLVT
jgi:hypothetical protein